MIRVLRRWASRVIDPKAFIAEGQRQFEGRRDWAGLIETDFKGYFRPDHVKDFDLDSLQEVLVVPSRDIMLREGKKVRPLLIQIAADLLDQTNSRWIQTTAAFVETVHSNLLILDDIMDGSHTRRGKPAVHLIYGLDGALASAGFVQNKSLRSFVDSLNCPDAQTKLQIYELVLDYLTEIYIGLGWDVKWHQKKDALRVPTFANYLKMCELKTAKLMNLGLEVLARLHHSDPQLVARVVEAFGNFGVAFQINDDLLNLFSQDFAQLKGLDDDLIEGKVSFPILHYCLSGKRAPGDVARLFDLLNKEVKDRETLDSIRHLIRTPECLEDGRREYKRHLDQCLTLLRQTFPSKNEHVDKLLAVSNYLITDDFAKSTPKK